MENLKIKFNEMKGKLGMYVKNLGTVAIIVGALFLGAFARDIYVKATTKPDTITETIISQKPRAIKETSIAINERGELMIIDRTDGSCQLFEDSVGKVIFDMYAARIYINKTK
jgi:hypothetical protein